MSNKVCNNYQAVANIVVEIRRQESWWRHLMETISALLALCAGIWSVTGEFPSQGPVTRNFDILFDQRLNERLCDLEVWWQTSKNYRTPLLYYIKLCASFQIHRWIQTGVIVRKRSFLVKIGNFVSCVALKFDGWPRKTIEHHFDATLSLVYHFKAIHEFKLELLSGNAQFESKSAIFLSRETLKFDRWPWKTIGCLCYATASFVHHFVAIREFKLELQSGNDQFDSKSTILWAVCL